MRNCGAAGPVWIRGPAVETVIWSLQFWIGARAFLAAFPFPWFRGLKGGGRNREDTGEDERAGCRDPALPDRPEPCEHRTEERGRAMSCHRSR